MSLRSILAVLLLGAVLYVAGVEELWNTLKQLDLLYVFYLVLLSVVMIWVSCVKWQLFIRSSGHDASIGLLMRLYTIGYFFNTFTPSYVGGDVVRSYQLGKDLGSQKDAFVSTFLERFTGLLAMALLGMIFVAIGTEATAGVEIAVLVVGVASIGLGLACFSQLVGNLCFGLAKRVVSLLGAKFNAQRLHNILDKLNDAMRVARSSPGLFLKAMIYSFVFHIFTVINTYVAARAVGWSDPDLGGLFVVVPLVLLVGMAPLTPSGLGIQEGAFLFFLQRVGGTRGESLGVGLVLRAKVFLIALLGWLLWLGMKQSTPSQKQAQTDGAC